MYGLSELSGYDTAYAFGHQAHSGVNSFPCSGLSVMNRAVEEKFYAEGEKQLLAGEV